MISSAALHGCRLGGVGYLNTRPLIYGIEGSVVLGHPSALAKDLYRGELDGALVPVFEALIHPGGYSAVDGVGIVAHGEVFSVFLAYEGALPDIESIELDPASLTSVNLCKVLFAEFYGTKVSYRTWDGTTKPENGRAILMIGDQAIRFRFANPHLRYLDLGDAWLRFTGLPFVFALWLLRTEYENSANVAAVLRATLARGMEHLQEIRAHATDYPAEFVRDYLGGYIRYQVGDQEKQAVTEFARLLAKHGSIPKDGVHLHWL